MESIEERLSDTSEILVEVAREVSETKGLVQGISSKLT